jgi:hypothetical protein
VTGFVEIDLAGHDGDNAAGERPLALSITDIATGCTKDRSVPNKAHKWVDALDNIAKAIPFPILGVDRTTDQSSSIITCCTAATSVRSPSPRRGRVTPMTAAMPEQNNGAIVRTMVGHHRYDASRTVAAQQDLGAVVTADELLLPATQTRLQGP